MQKILPLFSILFITGCVGPSPASIALDEFILGPSVVSIFFLTTFIFFKIKNNIDTQIKSFVYNQFSIIFIASIIIAFLVIVINNKNIDSIISLDGILALPFILIFSLFFLINKDNNIKKYIPTIIMSIYYISALLAFISDSFVLILPLLFLNPIVIILSITIIYINYKGYNKRKNKNDSSNNDIEK